MPDTSEPRESAADLMAMLLDQLHQLDGCQCPEHQPLALQLTERQWTLAVDALQCGADESTDPDWAQDCSDLATLLRAQIDAAGPGVYGGCQPVTLADHLGSAVEKILGA